MTWELQVRNSICIDLISKEKYLYNAFWIKGIIVYSFKNWCGGEYICYQVVYGWGCIQNCFSKLCLCINAGSSMTWYPLSTNGSCRGEPYLMYDYAVEFIHSERAFLSLYIWLVFWKLMTSCLQLKNHWNLSYTWC